MKVQSKAEKIQALFEAIQDVAQDSGNGILMLHDIKYVYDIDDSWEKESLFSGGRIILTAKKNGITLFGESFKVEKEPLEQDQLKDRVKP